MQYHGVNSIFISGLIYRKLTFRAIKLPQSITLRDACDSLRFCFNDISSIARNHLASDEIPLSIGSTDVLCENIVFCLNNFL